MSALKAVWYEGARSEASGGRVAYLVRGSIVYFSYLPTPGRIASHTSSTINSAERIIRAICDAEQLDWRRCTFYDIETRSGYPEQMQVGWYLAERLVLADGDKLNVISWCPVASSPCPAEVIEDDGYVPDEVIELFSEYIV